VHQGGLAFPQVAQWEGVDPPTFGSLANRAPALCIAPDQVRRQGAREAESDALAPALQRRASLLRPADNSSQSSRRKPLAITAPGSGGRCHCRALPIPCRLANVRGG
jgi:hypothetical protein